MQPTVYSGHAYKKKRIYDAHSHMTDDRNTVQEASENLKVKVACRAGDGKLGT
jgi:hypothetical protein